ncbi:MAG: hypothetical protein ACFCGT_15595 [Sandaracinaceae bacterium]
MTLRIRKIDYYYAMVPDRPGEAYALLTQLHDLGINLTAFTAVPMGPNRTQLAMFPDDSLELESAARRASLGLDGPHPALLVQGPDQPGALAEIHRKLSDAQVNVYASTGVSSGGGHYGYVIYFRPDDVDRAKDALEI